MRIEYSLKQSMRPAQALTSIVQFLSKASRFSFCDNSLPLGPGRCHWYGFSSAVTSAMNFTGSTAILLAVCMTFTLSAGRLGASTRTAASASYTDVSAAVSAAARGDTVLVPAGSATWSSTLTLTKGISLIGAGRDSTFITSGGVSVNISPDATAISNEEVIRVEAFTFDGNNSALNIITAHGASETDAKPFKNLVIGKNRLRNSGTTTTGSGAVSISGQVRGVIYSNIFDRCNVVLKNVGNDTTTEWSNGHFPQSFGTADQLFFEGNTIQYSSSGSWSDPGWTESGQGARTVVRYNQWNMANASQSELWDIHGFQYNPGGETGTMCSEYYGNTGSNCSGYRWINHRSPWGLYFNNIITGSGGMDIDADEYQGSCSADLGSPNYNPEITNTYCWNNTMNGTVKNMVLGTETYCGVSENRNWYNYNSSFSGTTGIGRGTTAPTMNCTAGVGYWQAATVTPTTDPTVIQNGVFWKATANNTWTAYYSPYVFPHPLVSGGVSNPNAAIAVSPSTLNFGTVLAGSTNNLTFTVQNVGGGTLTGAVSAVTSPFSLVGPSSYTLAGGASQPITVRYQPTVTGTNTQSLTFSGGGGAVATVTGIAQTQPAALISVTPTTLNFGTVQVGSVNSLAITVKNIGGGTLSGSASVPSSPFSIVGSASYSLAAGASQAIGVQFVPTATGAANQIVTLTGGGGAAVPVSGTGQTQQFALPGQPFDSTKGTITAPFAIDADSTISQSVETTDPAQGGEATYTISITNAGSYTVQAYVYAPSDAANSVFVNFDSEPISPDMVWDIPVNTALTPTMATWRATGGGTKVWSLAVGTHTLIIRGREAGVEIGQITILSVPTPPDNLRVVGP